MKHMGGERERTDGGAEAMAAVRCLLAFLVADADLRRLGWDGRVLVVDARDVFENRVGREEEKGGMEVERWKLGE